MTEPAWSEAGWDAVARELDAWAEGGRPATLWWRDDDAGPVTPALARLLALAGETGLPRALAVVPAWLTDDGAALVEAAPAGVAVLQHGYAHVDREAAGPPGGRPRRAECGPARPAAAVLDEVETGRARLAPLGSRLQPAFVPPWNRIAPAVIAGLPSLGFRTLSCYGPRPADVAAPRLRQVNTHVDPVRWHDGRRFLGAEASLGQLRDHLAARRRGAADPGEPTGLLTHHPVLDPPGWAFLARLLGRLRAHPAVSWPGLAGLLG